MNSQISEKLIPLMRQSFDTYNYFKDKCFVYKQSNCIFYVVKQSIPILYFGDLERYCQSNIKVITVGLNPSDREFKNDENTENIYYRFPINDSSVQSFQEIIDNKKYDIYYDLLNNYFNKKPYKSWFKMFEDFLNQLDCSFYSCISNQSIHTDYYSPIATTPTWSKLPETSKKELKDQGSALWKKLGDKFAPKDG
jgi:hypothetical protein